MTCPQVDEQYDSGHHQERNATLGGLWNGYKLAFFKSGRIHEEALKSLNEAQLHLLKHHVLWNIIVWSYSHIYSL